MVFDHSNHPFDILYEDLPKETKTSSVKWCKYKKYISRKCNFENIKNRNIIYFQTLSASSAKRTLARIFNNLFKSQHAGYEKFLSDEEKRFINVKTNRELVEDVKY